MWQEEKHWPNQDESVELATNDPELKKVTKSFIAVVQQEDIIGYLEEKYPTGQNSKESLHCYCAIKKWFQHIGSKQGLKGADSINCNNRLFNLEELKTTEKQVIKSVRQKHFKEEIM